MAIDIERTRDQLVDDFATVLSEAEDMLKKASQETGDRARDAARATDDYVHDNPWQAVGAAAAVGFVVGMLMTRR